jgi:hypothetical protein
MPSRNRLAAGGAAAVLAIGAAAEGAVRVFSHGAEDASHVRIHPDPLPPIDPHPLPGGGVPHGGGLPQGAGDAVLTTTAAGHRLENAATNDEDVQAVLCAAFSFFNESGYDPETDGPDAAPSFDDFAAWALGEVDKTPRAKAQSIYNDATELSDGDLSQLTSLYCDVTG